MNRIAVAVALGSLAALAMPVGAAAPPVAVSPGEPDRFVAISSSCPTFSWSHLEDVTSYEVAVYRVPRAGLEARIVVSVALPGGAHTWTPALGQCLEAGGRYAWSLRAATGDSAGEWSPPRLFEVASAVNEERFREALELVRSYLERSRGGEATPAGSATASHAGRNASAPSAAGGQHSRLLAAPDETGLTSDVSSATGVTFAIHGISGSTDDDSAGVVGQSTAASGDVAGVIGQVDSADGAAGVFDNTAGGDILRALANGTQVFEVAGSGQVTATGFTGDGSGLTGVTADDAGTLDGIDSTAFLQSADLDSESELESQLGDVTNVLTDSETAAAATALASDGTNCAAGEFAGGVDVSGNAQDCADPLAAHSVATGNTRTGFQALTAGTTGLRSTAMGFRAHYFNTADDNTAMGYKTLEASSGDENTAAGAYALNKNILGSYNLATGFRALYSNTLGGSNVGLGHRALHANKEGHSNTAAGASALYANFNGDRNTAVGIQALHSNVNGGRNTAVGYKAGFNATYGHDNIYLGSGAEGVAAEGNTIRIGGTTVGDSPFQQDRTFINGIRGVTTGEADAVNVKIDSMGQLGTVSSSRRHKEEISDMAAISDRLYALRPVTFRYKKPFSGGAKPIQFGLIAEEVAEVFPELVVYDRAGQPETVMYHLLNSLLLNEAQRQRRALAALQARLRDQEDELQDLRARLARAVAARLGPPRARAPAP